MGMGRAESEEHERERMLLGKKGHQEKTGKKTAIEDHQQQKKGHDET